MANVKVRNTSLEMLVQSELRRRGLRFRKHVKALPGQPDVVFPEQRLAVFIDGDFWHGWLFPRWKDSIPPFWQEKIQRNRHRDKQNFRRLKALGWSVMRIWGHQVKRDLPNCITRIEQKLNSPNGRKRSKFK